ncbi:YihY/virulence factor BrkB family protein [Corynebacterium sp. TA-R-1]|uniref:YihY/virulence factor BrkB family protein n=1 Tax=Corynebacterium stercoris TaxID=2943490 RepID=A0ABT1G121_9CORY|nr:YihY/virulence factor BrkB family protein [Corynebacterium stercoris]MCP1387711.1 YihY/virulence factor BrkB family protein [Corynebacterium stercoris]
MSEPAPPPESTSYRAELIMPYGVGEVDLVPPDAKHVDPLARSNRLTKPGWKLVFKRVIADWGADAMVDRGATLTYYSVLSVAPMLLAAYSIASLLLRRQEDVANSLMADVIHTYVPTELQPQAFNLLSSIIGTAAQSTVALTISLIISLLSASAYVRSFSRNANLIYGRTEGRNIFVTWITMWIITLVMVAGGVIIVLGALLTDSIVQAVLGPIAKPLKLEGTLEYLTSIFLPVWSYLRGPVILITAIALVSILYYLAPNVKPGRFRLLTLGSTLALTVVILIWVAFTWYLSNIGIRTTYGAFGTVLVILGLIWVMNIVLLEGVKIDAEVLRAKEIQVGIDSSRVIHAAPRSNAGAAWRLQLERWIDKSVAEIEAQRE